MRYLRIALALLAVVALGTMGCKRHPKVQDHKDLVVVNQGKMSFYDVSNKVLTPFEGETDSVINLIFADKDHLYYTVAKNENLSLKMLDLSQVALEPKQCADWNMTIDDAIDFMFGTVSDLYLDKSGENICIYKFDVEEFIMKAVLYNIKSGKIRMLEDDENLDLIYGEPNFDASHFYTENGQCYYVTQEGNTCLSDKIDFSQFFDEEEGLEDLDFNPISLSPNEQEMVYSSVVYLGEGWGYYCIANTDGKLQCLIKDSDIWDQRPQWLANGSLVYVGSAPRPEDDPEYDADWNTTQPCINLFTSQKETVTVSMGRIFAVRPFSIPDYTNAKQKDLEGCDVALLDNGKVTFYNSLTEEFIPFVVEDDSVVNGAFVGDEMFYYTVSIGNKLYLKRVYLGIYVEPYMVTDWDLNLDDCVSETYGKASELNWIQNLDRISINHGFSWDFYDFSEIRFYDLDKQVMLDGWTEGELETDDYDEQLMQAMDDFGHFVTEDGNFYYNDYGLSICLSDKIDFLNYVSDTDYYSEPEFDIYSIDPTRRSVAYAALIEWGDLGHGPLCMASLNGEVQVALEDTDVADLSWGWLNDGSLLYVGEEPRPTDDPDYDPEWNTTKPCVKILHPDGTVMLFSHSTGFVVKGK